MPSNPASFIYSIGTAVPGHRIAQLDHHAILESANGLSRLEKLQLRKVYHGSGINYRHSVLDEFSKADSIDNQIFHPSGNYTPVSVSKRMHLYDEFAADLALASCQSAIDQVEAISNNDITHLITSSCTGMSAPGVDIQLVEKLGLRKNTQRTCVNFMGCYAGINALKLANYIAMADPTAVILIAGVELCTLHYQRIISNDQLIANALFADGAAAAIISARKLNSGLKLSPGYFYSEFEPAGKNEMVWSIGDFGFDLKLSAYVPGMIKENICRMVEKLFTSAFLTRSDIDYYAIHPGGMKILEACEQALGISEEDNQYAYEVLRNFGNMSSVTIFFVLEKLFSSFDESDRKKKIFSCAFGPGLTMESMILEIA